MSIQICDFPDLRPCGFILGAEGESVGALVVCMPGLCGSPMLWQEFATALSAERQDLRIMGFRYPRANQDGSAPDLDDYARYLYQFLLGLRQQYPATRMYILAHSMAAHVALLAQSSEVRQQFRDQPELRDVELVMVNPSPLGGTVYWGSAHGLFLKPRYAWAVLRGGLVFPGSEDATYFGLDPHSIVGGVRANLGVAEPASIPAVRQLCLTGRVQEKVVTPLHWRLHHVYCRGDKVVPEKVHKKTALRLHQEITSVRVIDEGDHYPMLPETCGNHAFCMLLTQVVGVLVGSQVHFPVGPDIAA